jgi:ABC-type transport system substrate-binding protein
MSIVGCLLEKFTTKTYYKQSLVALGVATVAVLMTACATETQIVEVIKEVPIEVPVEVIVEKEVPVEVEVIKTVEKTVEVEVIKEIPKEIIRIVTEYKEIEKATGGAEGEIHVALGLVKPMIQLCSMDSMGVVGGIGVDYEAYEGLFTMEHTPPGVIPSQDVYSPEIATGWVVAQDLSNILFKIRRDSVWDGGYGPVTAHDVAFTYSSCVEDGSISNSGEQIANGHKTAWTAIDDYTVIHPVKAGAFSPTWGVLMGGRGHDQNTYGITSKAAYEAMGEDAYNTTPVTSGPYKVNFWRGHDEVEFEAKPSHWRATGHVARIHLYEMPEEATRDAAYRVGELDFTSVATKKIKNIIEDAGGLAVPAAMPWPQTIYMSGNYWAQTCPTCEEGKRDLVANPQPGYTPDREHPWIGRYGDDESMENARKVRYAMNLAIDRESIVANVLGGFADVAYSYFHTQFPPGDVYFKEEWAVPFDPKLAKQLMIDAGFPDGFSVEPWVATNMAHLWDPEVMDAVAEMWRKHLSLDVTIENSPYSVRRPEGVKKEMNQPWFHGWGLAPGGPKTSCSISSPGLVCGVSLPDEVAEWALNTETLSSQVDRIENNVRLADWFHKWHLSPSIASIPNYVLQGPRIKEWQPYWNPYFNNPTSVILND